jgi:hypothetical protein
MNWSDVVAPPKPKVLRQFAGLWLVFFVGIAAWRAWHGQTGVRTDMVGLVGLVVGLGGLAVPAAVRYVYTAWMIAAFPIGWTVSRVVLGAVFYAIFTPVAWIFKAIGRDVLVIRRRRVASYWTAKARASNAEEYFRQS